jgi:hypothetical protein
MGKILLFDLSRNKCRAMITADKQLSGLTYQSNYIWSVGRRRKVACHHMHTGSVIMEVQEPLEILNYSDVGITFNPCFNKEFFIYHGGSLRFSIFHLRSRKLVRRLDVAALLKDDLTFCSFKANERVAWRYCVGKMEPKLFIILNRYYPHLIIFDYVKCKVDVFLNIFPRVDWKIGPVVPVISLNILSSDLNDFIFFVNQTRDQNTKQIDTYLRVIVRNKKRNGYIIHPTRTFPSNVQ